MSQRRIIYYSGYIDPVGGFTVGEWLVYWTWQYFINNINFLEYENRINYITPEMPGALDELEWDKLDDYLKLIHSQS